MYVTTAPTEGDGRVRCSRGYTFLVNVRAILFHKATDSPLFPFSQTSR